MAIPLILILVIFSAKVYSLKIHKLFKREIYEELAQNVSLQKRNIKIALELLTLAFVILALARPQLGESTEKIKMEGFEVVFALDVSNSMLAEDLKPSRLEVAKRTIDKLLDRMTGYKVGLIAFAGNAGLVAPLTTDYSAIKTFLETTGTSSVSEQGTNFSTMIDAATDVFRRGGAESDEHTRITRVVVVFSDGEDHESQAIKKVKELTKEGVRIFTVATGTAQGAPVPIRDAYGQLQGYKKDKTNNIIMSKVNVAFLQELSRVGQGVSYNASFSGDEVRELERDFDKLEKTEFESESLQKYDERFQIPLTLALFILVAELLLTDYRPSKRRYT